MPEAGFLGPPTLRPAALAQTGHVTARDPALDVRGHEFWRDRASGRLYAVEFEAGVVSGCCGPLTVSEAEEQFLPTFDYSSERAGWFEEHREGYDLYRRPEIHPIERPDSKLTSLRIEDVMHPGMLTCLPQTPLVDVARMMATSKIHAVIVWGDEESDAEGIWGVISDLDLVAALAQGEIRARPAIGSASTVVTVRGSETLQTAARLMQQHNVAHLIVLADDRDRPVGVLSTLDIARAVART